MFIFLALFALLQLAATYFHLPETLPPEKRMPVQWAALMQRYKSVLKSRTFWTLTLALSSNFAGFFLYVASAPAFVIEYLGLRQDQFGWLFIPAMTGVILGAYLSGNVANRFSPASTVRLGYLVMGAAVASNITYNLLYPPAIPWAVVPVMLYTAGMSFAMPSITLMTLDHFPTARGMAASLQGFVQTMVMTFASGIISPLVVHSGLLLAVATLVFLCVGFLAWSVSDQAIRTR